MPRIIRKRDGSEAVFDVNKIRAAIGKANEAIGGGMNEADIVAAADEVAAALDALPGGCDVEGCQDIVENVLSRTFPYVAKAYILYRSERAKIRDGIDHLSLIYDEISGKSAEESDIKRENANVDGDTAMGSMLKYGSEGAKWYIDRGILPKRMAKAHAEGDIHIHDKDFYLLTETCCQIDLRKLFAGGFSTGHGYLREPNSIESYAALACIAIQANQNEMHGGQSVPAFDYDMADGVRKTYRKEILDALALWFEFEGTNGELSADTEARLLLAFAEAKGSGDDLHAKVESLVTSPRAEFPARNGGQYHPVTDWNALSWAHARAMERTERRAYQAMESFVHNLNTMHSRSGGQVPFSSVNYGTDVSWAGRLVIRELLKATDAGLGNGETAIFPVQIFKVREGVNYNPGDPNHDLFKLSIRVSAKRLFPNYEFLDAPFNAQFLRGNDPAYEVATMGCVQKNQVVTCKMDGVLRVESVSRIFDALAQKYGTLSRGLSEYVNTEGRNVFIYDSSVGSFVEMKKAIKNPPRKDWLLIKCESGRFLPVTPDHPLPVVGKGRTEARHIAPGDEIPAVWTQPWTEEESVNPGLAWLYGLILCGASCQADIVISLGLDEYDIVEKIKETACLMGVRDVHVKRQSRGVKGEYYDISLRHEFLKEKREALHALFGGINKKERHIPSCVFSWNREAKLAFIAGMFDADGHAHLDKNGTRASVTLGSVNEELAIQQAMLFQSLGVPARMYRNRYNAKHPERTRIAIYCPPLSGFIEEFIRFVACAKKRDRLLAMRKVENAEVPAAVRVRAVENCVCDGFAYDFETASDHFDVSGMNSHNCRTRVMANVDKDGEVTFGRGNLSFTTVNLPRIAIESEGNISAFNDILDERMRLVRDQLMHRYKIQCAKRVRNYPFLMGNGIWIGSGALDWGDTLESVLRHGTLTIGFIGLAEALTVLTGHHHGESGEAQELGLRIISRMRGFCDRECEESGLNFSLIGTPAEGLAGRFPKLDRKRFGTIKGVNDRAYYTNSFHVPVWYPIRAFRKIGIEAPYHALCNGGHITYVELDGDMAANPEAFEAIIRCMHDAGVGYGSVNHPLDRDPVCGYLGVIGDTCPRCGRKSGEPISRAKFKELRRRYGRGDALRG